MQLNQRFSIAPNNQAETDTSFTRKSNSFLFLVYSKSSLNFGKLSVLIASSTSPVDPPANNVEFAAVQKAPLLHRAKFYCPLNSLN